MLSVFVLKLSAQVPQFYLLLYANYSILATQRGGMAPWPYPLNMPLVLSGLLGSNQTFFI